MRQYGIIGKPLEHSYSAMYFTEKFRSKSILAEYHLYEMDNLQDIAMLMQRLHGFNVTYPYKQAIIAHLREIDEVAREIGAVNVVSQGKGYNTDWIGFQQSLSPCLQSLDRSVLILGTGGVSKAVQYALRAMGLTFTLVSRSQQEGVLTYDRLSKEVMEQHSVVVNCTPLGMYPDVESKPPLPYQYLQPTHLLYDCVYNPACTAFLQEGSKRGTRTINGKQMLYLQADAAWEIWKKE